MERIRVRPLVAAVLAVATANAGFAAERGNKIETGTMQEPGTRHQLRRDPPALPDNRLRISRLAAPVLADVGVRTPVSLLVEDRGSGGHLDIVYDAPTFDAAPLIEDLGAGRYRVTLQTSERLPVGLYRGMLQARMCLESPCVNRIDGASASTPYRVDVRWTNHGEWETVQRDAAHTGHVPIAVNPARIRLAWQRKDMARGWWTHPSGVATAPGRAFVSFRAPGNDHWVVAALDQADGSEIWRQEFVGPNVLNDPAYHGGSVYVATTGHEWTYLWSFDASDGMPRFQSSFGSQWGEVLAPTVANGIAYVNGGYYGGGTHAFAADDGLPLWQAFSGNYDASTPAVADGKAYYYDGYALQAYDAIDGSHLADIADPAEPEWHGYELNSAPMVGSPGHVLALSGNDTYLGRALVNFAPDLGTARWHSGKRYNTQPASRDGIVYAASNNPKSFDAIDEATGAVLWSWVPGTTDLRFHNNVVLTNNLAFVSTDRALHAVDLATRRSVWSYPTPGTVSISGDGMLFLVEGRDGEHTGRILAFRLY